MTTETRDDGIVPAGTFKALRYHNDEYESDTWVVPDRPFFMVKSKGKDFELSLASSGDGAKSSITETPQEMQGLERPNRGVTYRFAAT